MSTTSILQTLNTAGIQLRYHGGELQYRPVDAVTPELKELIERNWDALVSHLSAPSHAEWVAEVLDLFPGAHVLDGDPRVTPDVAQVALQRFAGMVRAELPDAGLSDRVALALQTLEAVSRHPSASLRAKAVAAAVLALLESSSLDDLTRLFSDPQPATERPSREA